MLVRVLLPVFLTIVVLHLVICYSFHHEESYDYGSFEENSDNNHKFQHNPSMEYGRERDDGRVIFRDYEEINTHTTQKPRNLQECILTCDVNEDDSPVCGTNGVTYKNTDQLKCAAMCGVDVRFRHYSHCPDWSLLSSSTESNDKSSCVSTCPTTPEYNPVCGTDNVTYKNHGKLLCAQMCGIDVQLKRHYPCPKKHLTSTDLSVSTISPIPSGLSREIKDCIHLCPATSEYSPVCGSDGRTYYNNGKLDCARHCGVDVTIYRRSRCA